MWGSGASRGLEGIRGIGSSRGVGASGGVQGPVGSVGDIRVWLVDWEPNHSGPQHSHWFPLESDLPHQGQARAPVQGPITPTGFPWEVTYPTKARQVTEMSSGGYFIHLKLSVCPLIGMVKNRKMGIFSQKIGRK